MSIKPLQAIANRFTISDPTNEGALINADSLPTGSFLEDGDVDAAVPVTVANVSTGVYKWSATVPTDYVVGTIVSIQIAGVLNALNIGSVVATYEVDSASNADILTMVPDEYWAKMVYVGGATADAYRAVQWFKNGDPVSSGVTLPLIQIIAAEDGTELVAETAMSEEGSSHLFSYDATGADLLTEDLAYSVILKATIDGSQRVYSESIIGTA